MGVGPRWAQAPPLGGTHGRSVPPLRSGQVQERHDFLGAYIPGKLLWSALILSAHSVVCTSRVFTGL